MDIEIIYEDKNILVINKPSGLVTHNDGKTDEPSVSSWFVDKYKDSKGVGEPLVLQNGEEIDKSGIVHRLDRGTSGLLLLVKNQKTFEFIKSKFKAREVVKVYRAFVYGNIKEDAGEIDRPIGRNAKDFRLRSAQRGSRGKLREAVTYYNIMTRHKDYCYIELRPKTGRTHQLRVHLKAINHPIVCDDLYAPKQKSILGFNRLALHASRLEVEIMQGKHLSFEAPLPPDFEKALKDF